MPEDCARVKDKVVNKCITKAGLKDVCTNLSNVDAENARVRVLTESREWGHVAGRVCQVNVG